MAQLISRGVVNANTHLWRDGMTDWLLVGATELAYLLPPPAAQTPKIVVTSAPIVRANTTQPVQNNTQTALAAAAAQFRAPKPSWMKILFDFKGRIPRRTYWAGICIWMGIMALMVFLSVLMSGVFSGGGISTEGDAAPSMPTISPLALIPLIAVFPFMWSTIVLQIKRWHDRGKPGTMVFVNMIPIGGPIWAFVECGCLRGTVGPNQFGKDPT